MIERKLTAIEEESFKKITTDTLITFQQGDTNGISTILASINLNEEECAIFCKKTPFHPVNSRWSDQPGDKGNIMVEEHTIPVIDTQTWCFNRSTMEIKSHNAIKRSDSHAWLLLIAHIVLKKECPPNLIGKNVELNVDKAYRHHLSAQHTGCHISILAFNQHLNPFWKKQIEKDPLDSFDFNANAIETSKISENNSIDRFRIGKSLRKKGFNHSLFLENFHTIPNQVNNTLKTWLATPAKITMLSDAETLSSQRTWCCNLNGIPVKIPCGGTHLDSTSALEKIEVALEKENDETFTLITTSQLKP